MPRYFSLSFALGILFAPSFVPAEQKPNAKAPNYYPMQVDNAWHYKVWYAGKPVDCVARITKFEDVNGQKTARLESTAGANISENLWQSSQGVFRYRNNGADITPPICLLKYPIKPGAKWGGDITVDTEKGKYACEAKPEAIQVPAGKFRTLRVTLRIENAKGKSATTTYWFADGVGIVKKSFDADGEPVVIELQKFERAKVKDKKER